MPVTERMLDMIAVQTIRFKNDVNGNGKTLLAVYSFGDKPYAYGVYYYKSQGFNEKQAAKEIGIEYDYIIPTMYAWQSYSSYNAKDMKGESNER